VQKPGGKRKGEARKRKREKEEKGNVPWLLVEMAACVVGCWG